VFSWPVFTLVFEVLILSACGGGGGGGDTPPGSPTGSAPSITAQPQSLEVTEGDTAAFHVVATGSSVTYQWYRNNSAVANAISADYSLTAAGLSDNNAHFKVTVRNTAGTLDSAIATLNVKPAAPVIVTQPQSQTVLEASTPSFTVVAQSSVTPQFQWRKNGVEISGANSASYIAPPVTLADSGARYDVLISNASGSIVSAQALLSVSAIPLAPSITAQPQTVSANVGDAATFQITLTGTAPFSYQWRRNGVDIVGATQATYLVSPVTALHNRDQYSVVVTNSAGSASSTLATLNVSNIRPIDLVAGGLGGPGNLNGVGGAARISGSTHIIDAADNIYLGGPSFSVRKIAADGTVSTWRAAEAPYQNVAIAAIDSNGIYYGIEGARLDKIAATGAPVPFVGQVSLVPGGLQTGDGVGSFALLNLQAIAPDKAGNLFFTDLQHTVRKIIPDGTVSTIAGNPGNIGHADGAGNAATFEDLRDIAVDAAGNSYVVDGSTFNPTNQIFIRKITPAGVVSTVAGGEAGYLDGTGSTAKFGMLSTLTVDATGTLYVADRLNNCIRKITVSGVVTTLAGNPTLPGSRDGTGANALFSQLGYITIDSAGNLLVSDNNTLRKVTPAGVVTTLAGLAPQAGSVDGIPSAARFSAPNGVAADTQGNLVVADTGNNTIRKVSINGSVTTLAGHAQQNGTADDVGANAFFYSPTSVALDGVGNTYVADYLNSAIRKITPTGTVSTLAGSAGLTGALDATGSAARFYYPFGIAVTTNGDVYVSDTWNDVIRKITPGGVVTTFAGTFHGVGVSDGIGASARFNTPMGLAFDKTGNLFVADSVNCTIRKITPSASVFTFAGTATHCGYADGANALFNQPIGLATDTDGNVYVADMGNRLIRKIAVNGTVSTVAGVGPLNGEFPWQQGVSLGALPGTFNKPVGITAVQNGAGVTLFVVDEAENSVLAIKVP